MARGLHRKLAQGIIFKHPIARHIARLRGGIAPFCNSIKILSHAAADPETSAFSRHFPGPVRKLRIEEYPFLLSASHGVRFFQALP